MRGTYSNATLIKEEFFELEFRTTIRSKKTGLEIMKTAYNNPCDIKFQLIIPDKLFLLEKIKKIEKAETNSNNQNYSKKIV